MASDGCAETFSDLEVRWRVNVCMYVCDATNFRAAVTYSRVRLNVLDGVLHDVRRAVCAEELRPYIVCQPSRETCAQQDKTKVEGYFGNRNDCTQQATVRQVESVLQSRCLTFLRRRKLVPLYRVTWRGKRRRFRRLFIRTNA